jgi:hypothetical protein
MTLTNSTQINYHHHDDSEIKTEQPRCLSGSGVPTNTYAVDIGPLTIFATRDQITDLISTIAAWDLS